MSLRLTGTVLMRKHSGSYSQTRLQVGYRISLFLYSKLPEMVPMIPRKKKSLIKICQTATTIAHIY